jgi:protein O-GlcNAc transferase
MKIVISIIILLVILYLIILNKTELFSQPSIEPMLPPLEKELFYKYLDKATNYLEFGSGGSTYNAVLRNNIKNIVSVESDKIWYNKINNMINNKKLIYKFIDLNANPNNFGYPENVSLDIMKSYPSVIEQYKNINFDLILIDGRFRVACALICFKYINNNCFILFDDIIGRPHYNEVFNYYDKIESVGRMIVFKKKQNINYPSEQLINNYINDPR